MDFTCVVAITINKNNFVFRPHCHKKLNFCVYGVSPLELF